MFNSVYEDDSEDTFGPGTDLVISVFAVLMILIVFVIGYYQTYTTELIDENKEFEIQIGQHKEKVFILQADLDLLVEKEGENEELPRINRDLKEKLGALVSQFKKYKLESEKSYDARARALLDRSSGLSSYLEKMEDDLDLAQRHTKRTESELSDAKIELKNLTTLLDSERVRTNIIETEKAEASEYYEGNRLSLEAEIEKLTEMLASKELQIETLGERNLNLEKENKLLYSVKVGKKYENFTRGEAKLTESAKKDILRRIDIILSAFGDANQINVIGYASPEPVVFSNRNSIEIPIDGNLLLSARRAISVAHFLASIGVPYQCISARGVGRSRSDFMDNVWLRQGRSLSEWDQYWADRDTRQSMKDRYEKILSRERRIEIRADHDDESTCQFTLSDALNLKQSIYVKYSYLF